ncbi:MAG: ATP-dependent dethiobiotin synthetase BioD [Acidimicrobiales bacterium]
MLPERLVLVCGTGTDVGKTWVAARMLGDLRGRGVTVAARKPAQSFDVDAANNPVGGPTDADLLGEASGEPADRVCPPEHTFHRAMAPPMAAEALGLPDFTVAELLGAVDWPTPSVEVGLVETAGGVRSPQATDGDVTHLVGALRPGLVVLVADAGLGTINLVRLSMEALGAADTQVAPATVVVLDRYDSEHDLHCRNRRWLVERDGYTVVTLPGEEARLVDLVMET